MKNVTKDKFDYELVYEFCDSYAGVRETGTITGYRWAAHNFLTFLDEERNTELDDVEWTDVDAWVKDMVDTYPDSTVKTRYNHLRSFFDWLKSHKEYFEGRALPVDHDEFSITDYIDRGTTAKGQETAARGGIVFVTPNEYRQLLNHVPEPKFRNELIIKCLWHLGLRRKELTDIAVEPRRESEDVYGHLDFSENRLRVPPVKGTETRPVWFRDELAVPLKRWIRSERRAVYYADESEYLFPTRRSEQLSPKRVTKVVTQAAENAGIQTTLYEDANGNERTRITPHALRHGYAVQHVRNGTNVKVLNDLLGHEDMETTQVYLQFDDETKREAQHRHAPEV